MTDPLSPTPLSAMPASPKFEKITDSVSISSTPAKVKYRKPDYDDASSVEFEVKFRNWLQVKVLRLLSISYEHKRIMISDIETGKNLVVLPASQVRYAVPSENVDTQVTILTKGIKRETYKVWVDDDALQQVQYIIRDINKLVELYQDMLEEQEEV
eukprot:gnl/Dysnectes_brevis/967_a1077_4567.p1 GENE.gnl/Dysnectes_brevis/967_a1077_4567~~gnl/Dysnectes_brevis/967_a1077_4567.p1  ORF type:complete len:183 (-),score=20.29 gnl/Dysnectes_brevis/967_a1077_4567:40-507(-)